MISKGIPIYLASAALSASSLAACGGSDENEAATVEEAPVEEVASEVAPAPSIFADVSGGEYGLEKGHASLLWKISHNGLSYYTARFTSFDATLDFDPDNPASSSVTVAVDPTSVRTDHPDGDEWDAELANGDQFFNAGSFPEITFVSTGITPTGDTTGLINGDLTLLGTTLPITLEASFNGVANPPWYGGRDVVGFSATSTIKRSDFGMNALIPNIGDEVSIIVEAEFLEAEG
ncbi:MAG: YceI family protein [Pseudomonadota bacterium]